MIFMINSAKHEKSNLNQKNSVRFAVIFVLIVMVALRIISFIFI